MDQTVTTTEQTTDGTQSDGAALPGRRRKGHALWRWGCLGVALFSCGGFGVLAVALQSGPIVLAIPGGTAVKLGSNDTVLRNSSFKAGTSYFFDLNGNGVRNILELNYLEDSHSLELVLHHSTKQERAENQLLHMNLP
ncbi:MAG: hypothetical protein ABI670_20260 [Chloroflexota bacterium]